MVVRIVVDTAMTEAVHCREEDVNLLDSLLTYRYQRTSRYFLYATTAVVAAADVKQHIRRLRRQCGVKVEFDFDANVDRT